MDTFIENNTPKKECKMCNKLKELDEFYSHSKTKDGRQTYCKECERDILKEWRRENNEKYRECYKEWNNDFRISIRMFNRFNSLLKRNGINKEDLGFYPSIKYFYEIGKRKLGDNPPSGSYGEYDIHHEIPFKYLDKDKDGIIEKCEINGFCENVSWLERGENRRIGNKVENEEETKKKLNEYCQNWKENKQVS